MAIWESSKVLVAVVMCLVFVPEFICVAAIDFDGDDITFSGSNNDGISIINGKSL